MNCESQPVVELSRVIQASCSRVFQAWTDPALLRRWLAPGENIVEHAETDLRVGGRFLLRTRGPDGARHRIFGLYRAIEPDRHILQTWTYDGPIALLTGEETSLQIDLAPRGDRATDLRLIHRRIARADVRDAYRSDWPTCFDKLQTALN